ncbi:IS91 family transposase [Marinobacter sp. RI1]|uniref:IS91 family transposase n=1 Tax=Marinobacter sp. RI1 TaxID=3158171 RepID=UPI0034E85F66
MAGSVTVQSALNQFLSTDSLDSHRRKVCRRLMDCRTARMGGMEMRCDHCKARTVHYYGCRDRHCPQCQGRASQRWCERQRRSLLPVPYFHLVFTVPHALNGWVQVHPDVVYRRLFESVWGTLSQFGYQTKHLQGELGMTAVLHTWGQNLSRHVHVHCLIPGGALTEAGEWHRAKHQYLFPVRALSRRFRGRMVSSLRHSVRTGELHRLQDPDAIDGILNEVMQKEWVVYARHCLNQAETVVDYLARYSHRIAISNARLVSQDGDRILLRYKDYREDGRQKSLQMEGAEFIRRFLMHILPKGFMRIRHFGYLSNRTRGRKLTVIHQALQKPPEADVDVANGSESQRSWPCPRCEDGVVHMVRQIPRFNVKGLVTG